MKRTFLLFIVCALTATITAEEIDVRLFVPDCEAMRRAAGAGLMIDNYVRDTGELYGVVADENLGALSDLGYPLEIMPEDDARAIAARAKEADFYPLFSDYVTFMQDVVADHPVIASLDTFGYSVEGRPLLMMKISNRVAWDEAEPEFCYISTMHGDEPPGTVFLMWLIDSLTDNYGTDPRVTRLVDSCEIFINPLLNPDGYTRAYPTRRNANGIDLNRNYPVPDGSIGGDYTYTTEPETDAIMAWFPAHNVSYTINFHTGALVANYPWDYTGTRAPDDSLYKFIARNYADRNIPMFNNSGGSFDHGITNGYDWYVVKGSIQDWTYWQRGDLHLTVELGNHKTPPFDSLDIVWEDNYDAYCAAIEVCLNHGVCGVVTDSVTGESLGVTVSIDAPNKQVYSDSINGYYHRILLHGVYNLTFSKPGYHDKTLPVTVPDSGLIRLDVLLVPDSVGNIDGSVEFPEMIELSVFPNPFNSSCRIDVWKNDDSVPRSIEIYDITGKRVAELSMRGAVLSGCSKGHDSYIASTVWRPGGSLPSGVYLIRAGDSGPFKRAMLIE